MAWTHSYELKIGEQTFEGDVEVTNAGVLAYKETSEGRMSERVAASVKRALDEVCTLPANYDELKKFELVIKE